MGSERNSASTRTTSLPRSPGAGWTPQNRAWGRGVRCLGCIPQHPQLHRRQRLCYRCLSLPSPGVHRTHGKGGMAAAPPPSSSCVPLLGTLAQPVPSPPRRLDAHRCPQTSVFTGNVHSRAQTNKGHGATSCEEPPGHQDGSQKGRGGGRGPTHLGARLLRRAVTGYSAPRDVAQPSQAVISGLRAALHISPCPPAAPSLGVSPARPRQAHSKGEWG